jgi:hypothetical protein
VPKGSGVRSSALHVTELNTLAPPIVPVLVKWIASLASLFAIATSLDLFAKTHVSSEEMV